MYEAKEKLKILFLVQMPPPIHGASLRNKAVFESEIMRDKFNFSYIPFSYSNTIEELGTLSLKKIYIFIIFFVKLLKKSALKEFDLVYFTYSLRKNGILRDSLLVALLRMFKIPIIFHFRNQGARILSENRLLNFLMKFSFNKGFFICLSKHAAIDVEGFIDKRNLFIVNNGIEPFRLNSSNKLSNDEIFRIFFISNLRKEKGIFELLDIYKSLLSKTTKELHLSIAGEEGDVMYSELEHYIKSNNLSNVNLIGPLYGKEKYEMYNRSDLFLFPSQNEVFPGVILEAMQFGLPIVTSDVGSIPSIIKTDENGIICSNEDLDSMILGVLKIINDPYFSKKIGRNARLDFIEKYTIETFENNMLSTFSEIKNRI